METEKAFIGCLILDPELMDLLDDFDDSCLSKQNLEIFNLINKGRQNNVEIDTIWLSSQGVNYEILSQLVDHVTSTSFFNTYLTTLNLENLQKKIKNQIKESPNDLEALHDEISTFLDSQYQEPIESLTTIGQRSSDLMLEDSVSIEIDLPWNSLNKMMAGLRRQKLIFIGGRPGHHKTNIAINMATQVIHGGHKVLYLDYEMGEEETFNRFVGISEGVCQSTIQNKLDTFGRKIEKEERIKISEKIMQFSIKYKDNLFITSYPKFHEIKNLVKKYQADVVFIDHIQIFANNQPMLKGESKAGHINTLCQKLKLLARELNIVIVCPSQIDRSCQGPPKKSHFKESGGIEENGDILLGVWWPHSEGLSVNSYGDNCSMNFFEMEIAKNRSGPVGKLEMFVNPSTGKITEQSNYEDWHDKL